MFNIECIFVTLLKYCRDGLSADKEIAYLRALSAVSKETYRQNTEPEKCTFDSGRGPGVKEIHLLADRVHCTRIDMMAMRQKINLANKALSQ